MNYIAVLDYDQLVNIPSFLEESEYVVAGIANHESNRVTVLFANSEYMQVDFSYFEDMGITDTDLEAFGLSEDGQCFFFGENSFEVAILWERDDDDRIVRSSEFSK